MDKIKIKDLEVYAHHGVYEEENRLGQKFVISVICELDVREAGLSDDLDKSVNYGEIGQFVDTYAREHTFRLLEALAEHLAREILLRWERIRQVTVEIKKPWAPIGLPLDTASVEITRARHVAYIALGSNMGDKKAYLDGAVKALECADTHVTKVSDYIVTEPYGVTDQDEFLNGALELETLKTPEELLAFLHEIEAAAKRQRIVRWGPRTLDLDIIFYDDLILDAEDLQIPHIEMHKRDFVLEPMCRIAPYKRHPILKKTVRELREALQEQ